MSWKANSFFLLNTITIIVVIDIIIAVIIFSIYYCALHKSS